MKFRETSTRKHEKEDHADKPASTKQEQGLARWRSAVGLPEVLFLHSWSGRTSDAEEVAIRPEPLANSSASEILNTATTSTSVPFYPPAPGKGIQREKTGELEPSDLSKLRITAEIFTVLKSPTASASLQPATPAAGSGFGSPAVPLETILYPTNSTTA